MSTPAVVFQDVWKSFDERAVFRGLSAEIPSRGLTFLVGRSGAGKSVLSRLAVGLERPDRGEVSLFGQPLSSLPQRKLLALRKKAPYLVQGAALLDWLTVAQNVALASDNKDEAHIRQHLSRVGLEDVAQRRPPELGPGVRKRAAIARALALEPSFLFFDEPTTGLDKGSAKQVSDVLASLRKEGLGAVVVSHDYPLLERIADRVVMVSEGTARSFEAAAFIASQDPEARALLDPVRSELGRHG